MSDNEELSKAPPVLPYIRESDFAIRRPWRYPERRLLDYLLIYIQEGVCRIIVDRQPYRFEAGQFCLVQPGSLVDLEGLTDTVTPFAHLDIFYNPKRERSFPTRPGQLDLTPYAELLQPRLDDIYRVSVPVRPTLLQPKKCSETLIQMIELWQLPDPLSQLKAQLLATELVTAILEAGGAGGRSSQRAAADSFNWIVSYFSVHLNEPLSIRDMAARASLSPSRFSALFRRKYGMPPHQFLLEMRINHAKELLSGTELTQEEIASYCGFADIHHFSKSFRGRTGLSPGAWRDNGHIKERRPE